MFLETMQMCLENLPVELVGTKVLGFLSLKDVIILERACGSKKSHLALMKRITYCAPAHLSDNKHSNISALNWFTKRKLPILFLTLKFPGENPCLHLKNLKVVNIDLIFKSPTTADSLKHLMESNMGHKVINIRIEAKQNKEVMEQLSAYTGNVKQLTIRKSDQCNDWLTVDILSRWKLKEISLYHSATKPSLLLLIVHTCAELTSIKLYSNSIDDAAVLTITQHCTKLKRLQLLNSCRFTYKCFLILSERGLPLEELAVDFIPNIPTADIARRCGHALSCILHLNTVLLPQNGQDANILLPHMTGLTSVDLEFCDKYHNYVPLLIQHCHKLTKIEVTYTDYSVTDILSLCCINPLLKVLCVYVQIDIPDTALIELIHACPHLHTLDLTCETDVTDIGILALSAHCHQLQVLDISRCHKVTETTVLQLLQRCRKLTTLEVSSSSLSEET